MVGSDGFEMARRTPVINLLIKLVVMCLHKVYCCINFIKVNRSVIVTLAKRFKKCFSQWHVGCSSVYSLSGELVFPGDGRCPDLFSLYLLVPYSNKRPQE